MGKITVALAASFIALALSMATFVWVSSNPDPAYQVMNDVQSSIYYLYANVNAGTGFATTTASGQIVIITNSHVCERANTNVMYTDKDGTHYTLKIMSVYSDHDLCMLEAPENAVPLKLADVVKKDDVVYTVGFTLVPYMSSSRGRFEGLINAANEIYDISIDKCVGKKFIARDIQQILPNGDKQTRKVCIFIAPMVVTTNPVDAGASGSPMLNSDEEVIGVVRATSGRVAWAYGVPLYVLKDFLSKH
jgi:S1-C subfamily serine protease